MAKFCPSLNYRATVTSSVFGEGNCVVQADAIGVRPEHGVEDDEELSGAVMRMVFGALPF